LDVGNGVGGRLDEYGNNVGVHDGDAMDDVGVDVGTSCAFAIKAQRITRNKRRGNTGFMIICLRKNGVLEMLCTWKKYCVNSQLILQALNGLLWVLECKC
jgi:hypothetical protein